MGGSRAHPNEATSRVGGSLPLLGFHESDFSFEPSQDPRRHTTNRLRIIRKAKPVADAMSCGVDAILPNLLGLDVPIVFIKREPVLNENDTGPANPCKHCSGG